MSSIPAVKTTTRPTSAGRNFVALSFLVLNKGKLTALKFEFRLYTVAVNV